MVIENDRVSMLMEQLSNLQRLNLEGANVTSLSSRTWEELQNEIDNRVSKEQDKRRSILLQPIICYERKR
jgi:hypothetical protein